MPKKMKPGKLTGPSHKRGGILLEAEGGEYIIKKSSVKKLGKSTLDKINKEGKLPMKKDMKKYYGGGMAGMSKKRMMMEKGGIASSKAGSGISKKNKLERVKNREEKMDEFIGKRLPGKNAMKNPRMKPAPGAAKMKPTMKPLKKKAHGGIMKKYSAGTSVKTYSSL